MEETSAQPWEKTAKEGLPRPRAMFSSARLEPFTLPDIFFLKLIEESHFHSFTGKYNILKFPNHLIRTERK